VSSDPREDFLLCPECLTPVEMVRLNLYTCRDCQSNYVVGNLIRSSDLEKELDKPYDKGIQEVKNDIQ
jgi:hypothetical protein